MKMFLPVLGGMAVVVCGCASVPPGATQTENLRVEQRAQAFLSAYARNDQEAVLRMVDPQSLSVYGSDVSEFVTSPDEFKKMMSNDFRLWHTAQFGPLHDVDIRVGGDLASVFFNVSFSAGGGPALPVRVTSVWHRIDGEWYLTQSASAVPTTGSSAADLLKQH